MITDQEQVGYLNFLVRTYAGLNKVITSTKNRLQSMNPDMDLNNYWVLNGMVENKQGTSIKYQGLESIKGQVARRIEKELEFWPVWSEWMVNVPGIGPAIGGNLVLLYYYRFMPVCQDCGTVLEKTEGTFFCQTCQKGVKGKGNLKFRMDIRNFPMISSWWHFMGRHCNDDGNMPKRAKGVVSDWSTPGRQVGFQIGEQFNYQTEDHLYKAYLLKRKRRHEVKNEMREKPWTKGRIHNAAKNEAVKLFLSHMWQVARTIDGLPVTEPYVVAKDPVHKVIPPYYWEGMLKKAA